MAIKDVFICINNLPGPMNELNTFYWPNQAALDSAVVNAQNLLSLHGVFLTDAMHPHRETIK